MKKNYHKLLVLIFSLITVWMVAFPTEVSAYAPRMSISNNTKLEVSGEGAADSSIIWSDLDKSKITEIEVKSGITGIGDRLFRGFSNVTSVTIPSSVTWIGSEAFHGCSSLDMITIPKSVTQIGSYAFAQCSSLYYVGLGNGLQTIGDYAFGDCIKLPKVTLPASVNELGVNIFSGCEKLTQIVVGYGNTSFYADNGVLFNANGTELVAYPKGLGGDSYGVYQVPEGTLSIGKYAFSGSNKLYDVTLPEGVKTIENYAFSTCQSLTAVAIPESVTSIGVGSFNNCPNLTIYGVSGSYAQTYAKNNNIPFKELEEPNLELSTDSIEVSVIGKPTYDQQVAAAKTLTITNRSSRAVNVTTDIYKGEYPADSASASFWPESYVQILGAGESMTHTVKPREIRCGHYEYSLHVDANGKKYAEVPVSITFKHNPSHVQGVAPTCTKAGQKEYYKCFICNTLYWDEACTQYAGPLTNTVIPATGHTEEVIPAVAPTCIETGFTAGKKCSVCGEVLEAPTEVEALGHDYQTVAGSAVEATCTKAGKEADQKCSRCGDLIEGKEIPAKGHTEVEIPAVAPTCTEAGSTAGKKCSVCGEVLEAPKEVEALGHAYVEVAGSAIEATCTEVGKEADRKCSRCGDLIEGKEIPAKGHTVEAIPAVAPTCTEAGSTAGKKCSVCGEVLEAPTEVKALGHDYKEVGGSAVKETCTKAGKEADQECSRCGDLLEGKEIPAKGHTEEVIPEVAPTCTKAGSTVGKKCSVCGEVLEAPTEVKALGHDYKEVGGSAVKETCTKAGKEADQECSRCGDLLEGKEIPAKGHTEEVIPEVAPTCTKAGSTVGKKCSVCGEVLEAPTEVEALGHAYVEMSGSAVEATCTEAGKEADRKCSRCDDLIEGKEIPAKGHTEEEVFAVPPTCTETGFTAGKKCSVCGAPLEAPKEVAALGHKWDNGKVINQPTVSAPGVKTYTCEVCGETRDETIAKLTPAEDPVLGSVTTLDSKAKALSENGDPAGSGFRILQVKGKKVAKTSITISWKKVRGATGYVIYGAPCGSKYRKIKEVKGTSYKQTGLKKGKYYKYFVSARDKSGKILASSKTVHIATSGGKKGNTKSVKLNKKKVPLKKGKTFKLKAKLKNGKLKVSNHRKVAYESDNPKVATVSGSGNIKAKSKGTCTIYAYAQNGVFAKCKVTVK